jgi:hypothetical protein
MLAPKGRRAGISPHIGTSRVRQKGRNSDRDGFQDRIANDPIIGARLNQ